jgi:arylsulfatase A-like enzyme
LASSLQLDCRKLPFFSLYLALILENGTKDPNGVPQLYASNFQLFSVAQKQFGYLKGSTSEKPIFVDNVTASLDVIDTNLGTLVDRMKAAGTYTSTLLIVCAKHGQAPIDPTTLHKIDPQTLQNATSVKFAQVTSDDIGLIWLADPTIANVDQAKSDLLSKATEAGIAEIFAGPEVYQHGFGDPRLDPRVPDIIIRVVPGVIYTSPGFKLMEHGGLNPDDLTTAIFVHNPSITAATIDELVFTRQIAVTALEALGAPVTQLDGAQIDGTVGLPGLGF